VNQYLHTYQPLHELFDTWIILAIKNTNIVYQWRLQQEHNSQQLGKPGLTDEQVR
jgi:pantothenate kinase-related protein Tda10